MLVLGEKVSLTGRIALIEGLIRQRAEGTFREE
jgi:hypothetical protein